MSSFTGWLESIVSLTLSLGIGKHLSCVIGIKKHLFSQLELDSNSSLIGNSTAFLFSHWALESMSFSLSSRKQSRSHWGLERIFSLTGSQTAALLSLGIGKQFFSHWGFGNPSLLVFKLRKRLLLRHSARPPGLRSGGVSISYQREIGRASLVGY